MKKLEELDEIVAEFEKGKMDRRTFISRTLLLGLTLTSINSLLSSFGKGVPSAFAQTPPAVATAVPAGAGQGVRFGYLVADQLHQYILPIGMAKGYFKELGVNVDPKNYSTAGILMQALQSNDIDMGVVGVSGAMIAKSSGADVVIIGSCNHKGSSLVVDPSINKFEDLKGLKVADVGIASNHHTLLMMLVKKYQTHIQNLTINPTQMPIYATNKEVQGIIAYEPWPTRILQLTEQVNPGHGWKRLFISDQIMPDQQCCVLVTTSKFAKAHPEAVAKVVKVDVKSIRHILDHKDDSLNIISQFSALPKELLEAAFFNMGYPWPPRVNSNTSKELLRGIIDRGYN